MSPRPLPVPPSAGELPVPPETAMELALAEARLAASLDEAPVGAALFGPDGRLLARAHNAPIRLQDPTAHAEILCLRRGGQVVGNYRMPGCVLAVTLEPCLMCVGAVIHARLAGVIYGATDPKSGALVTHLAGNGLGFVNHKFWVLGGVRAEECGGLLSDFFRARRGRGPGDDTPAPAAGSGDAG
ncbi:MAG: nucleoside deaminase [Desulfovibrionaceae bacterium]